MGRQGMRMMKKSIMFAGTVAAVAVSVAFAEQPNDWAFNDFIFWIKS